MQEVPQLPFLQKGKVLSNTIRHLFMNTYWCGLITLHHLPFEHVYFNSMYIFPEIKTDVIKADEYSRMSYIHVKTLLPGGKMWLSQQHPDSDRFSALFYRNF